MDTTTTRTPRTIALTGRTPVRIVEEDWPIVAGASDHLFEGEHEFQSSRHTRMSLDVRQHADGRAVVYGHYHYDTAYRREESAEVWHGELLPAGADIPQAVQRVAASLDDARKDAGAADRVRERSPFARLAQECLADLPAEVL